MDLLSFDFHDHKAVHSLDWRGTERDQALPLLKTYQRLLRVADDVETSEKLLSAGVTSAHQIASMSQTRFARTYTDLFGGSADAARAAHRRAVDIQAKSQQLWASVHDVIASKYYANTRFINVQDEVASYFQSIPSYQDLFGGLDYLECPHCRSILSPAAYFVDLMRITDEYVTYPNRHSIPAGMSLEARRPDLFTLPLDCANTDTVISYLSVVNAVLEEKLFGDLGPDLYQRLALAAYPFNLPFNLPLVQTRLNLSPLKTGLTEVYTTFFSPMSAGAVQSGSPSSVTLASTASSENGYYRGMTVTLTSGTGVGQTRRVISYDGSTRVAQISPNWSTAPTTGTRYEVYDAMDVARESLGLSMEQYTMETTPQTAPSAVAQAWGYQTLDGVLPVFTAGAGRISFAAGSVDVTGDGATRFDTQLSVGDQIWCGPEIRSIASISGPSSLKVYSPWKKAAANVAYQVSRWSDGTGLITIRKDSTTVTGNASANFMLLQPGDLIQCSGKVRTVVMVRSAQELLVDAGWQVDAANARYSVYSTRQLSRMTTFLARTGMDRVGLDALLRQETSDAEFEAGVTESFFINDTGEGLPPLQLVTDQNDPNNGFQTLVGLSVKRLDRLSRFIRLQRQLVWTAANTDWLMVSVNSREIDSPAIEAMAFTQRLAEKSGLQIDVVAGFWHNMKTVGRVDEQRPQDLFDRVYNNPALLRGANPYTSPTPIPFDPARPLTWDIEARTGDNATIRSRLLGALSLTDDNLTLTAHFVRALQGRAGSTLLLDLATLSWLYRLVRQAAWLQLSMDAYFTLLWMVFYPQALRPLPPPRDAITADPQTVQRTETAANWVRSSPFDVYDLQYILTGEQSPYFKQGFTLANLRSFVDALATGTKDARLSPAAFVFEDIRPDGAEVLFSALAAMGLVTPLGIIPNQEATYTEVASLFPIRRESFITPDIDPEESAQVFDQLVNHNPPYLIPQQGGTTATLSEIFTQQTSLEFLFPNDPLQQLKRTEVQTVLLQVRRDIENTRKVLADAAVTQEDQAEQGVADFLGVDREILSALLGFSAGQTSLAPQRVDLLTPIPADAPVPAPVVQLITTLWRAALWVRHLSYTAEELVSITADPAPFEISNTQTLDFTAIENLDQFRRLTVALNDQNGVLLRYFAKPLPEGIPLLSGLTGWSVPQVTSLIGMFWPAAGGREADAQTVAAVTRLKAAFDLCDRTHADVFFMQGLNGLLHLSVGVIGGAPITSAWAVYMEQAGRTLDLLSGRYGSEFSDVYASVSGQVDTAKRDALTGYAVWYLNGRFPFISTPSDLSQFLLIDLEMSDCANTSRIAQGISSVQMYLQRCRMNLEAGVNELDVDPTWWEWLSLYRVWEANRKIFLYPENYLQPGLRSGESPEFVKLAGALLQSDLSQASVSDAFLQYFDAFNVLGGLVPVGSCRADTGRRIDDATSSRLFLIGRTATDPYIFYVRWFDDVEAWSPWLKVDLAINSPDVAPVFAFDRLFLFWAELDTGKMGTIKDANADPQSLRNGAIKYSFLNAGGQWVQPQIMADNVPTEVLPNPYKAMVDNPVVQQALTPEALYWRQPYPLNIARGLPGTGRLVITKGMVAATGINTQFQREMRAGDRISAAGQTRVVEEVFSDTALVVDQEWTRSSGSASQGALFKVIPVGQNDNSFPSFVGAGTITITQNNETVIGSGTLFTKQVAVGDRLLCANEVRTVALVSTDVTLLVDQGWTATRSGQTYTVVPGAIGSEQLVVMYGGPLATAANLNPPAPQLPPNPGKDPFLTQLDIFDYTMFYSTGLARDANAMRPPAAGQVTLNYAAILDADLQALPTRALIPDYQYSSNNNPRPYQYRIDRSERLLRSAQSDNNLADNYWGNNAAGTPNPPKPTGLYDNLLYNISAPNSSLRNVGNQPGWAIFDNGDESFLVRSTERRIEHLSNLIIDQRLPDAQLGEAIMLSASAYTDEPIDFDKIDFEFIRMTTTVVPRLRQRLFAGGIDRLLSLESQLLPELPFNRFYAIPTGNPPPHVIPPLRDRVDFNGAYGLYFQEIFLFAPWLIADRLRTEQRFEDAKHWYQYIFNPTARADGTEVHPNDRYWRYLPFRSLSMDSLISNLTDPAQIYVYNNHPFDPDAIARLRPTAYAKGVVLDYIDNLMQWGDFLFGKDTSESINQATQVYTLAQDLLGPRPQAVGVCPVPKTQNFNDIRAKYGQDIPQFLIDLENGVPQIMNSQEVAYSDVPINDIKAYFCVPENTEIMRYWDLIEDRLFKIRHCMNLQGVVRPLPLFEPPLDPNQLIREAASSRGGTPTGSAGVGRIPAYRFTVMLEKAKAFTSAVMSLGSGLLAALEKQDAEQMALLRTTQERVLLDLSTRIKELQIQQATDAGLSLEAVRSSAATRSTYYRDLIAGGLSSEEKKNLVNMEEALVFNTLANIARTASGIGYAVPQVGSPFAMTYGGAQLGAVLTASAAVFEILGSIATYNAQNSLTMAGYKRRSQEWELQLKLAQLDGDSADAQIEVNAVQLQIAERDLEIHQTTIAQNREIESFLRKKFTNVELYQWMAGRLSEVYFQSWLLALELARSAERALQYELNSSQTFLNFVYWDSARKGLLAGEGLFLALSQMEKAYLDGSTRSLDIEKTISLAQINPRALLSFKATGECIFDFSERLFDFDFPGHYLRKIATISITIPAVVGPYETVHATLTQLGNQLVLKPDIETIKFLLGETATVPGASTLRSNVWANQQVALSRASNDSGVFQLDFNDPRFLPFEGTGAVSSWRLSMPPQTNRFDYSTISDVLIQIAYTAVDGGALLRSQVVQQPQLRTYVGSPLLSLAQLYSQQWFTFMSDHSNPDSQTLSFPVSPKIVPPHLEKPKLVGFFFQMITESPASARVDPSAATPYISFQATQDVSVAFAPDPRGGYFHAFTPPVPDMSAVFQGERQIRFTLRDTPASLKVGGFLDPAVVRNIALVLYYEATVKWQ